MRSLAITLRFSILLTTLGSAQQIPRLHQEYDPARWPEAHLRLSQAGTLDNVFDAGLRPYRFPGLENTTLEIKHLRLKLYLSSNNSLPSISAELIRIKPFIDGEIATIKGFTPKLTLDQARAEMVKWLPHAVNGRTEKDLDEYLEAVKADYLDFDDPYRGRPDGCGIGWNEPGWKERGGGPKCGLGFRKTASQTHPLRLHFSLSWLSNRTMKDAKFYRIPIPPPPGYEHMDMTAPKNFGPDSMVDILRAKGVDIGDGKGGIPQEEYFATLAGPDQRRDGGSNSEPGRRERSKEITAWWIVAGVLVLLGLLAWIRRKGRAPAEG